jgi:peptidoglycan biosynthesis protein MviN/MurJ (putative lipid II flippase)
MQTDTPEHAKAVVDALSIATVVGTLAQILPAMAALFSIVWSVIRIWETQTVKRLVRKWRSKSAKKGN